jgi:hypothetical protein
LKGNCTGYKVKLNYHHLKDTVIFFTVLVCLLQGIMSVVGFNAGVRRLDIAYYITGHGLGHATRSLELISSLILSNKYNVHVVSHVKSDFFLRCLSETGITPIDSDDGTIRFSHADRVLDTGALQTDVFAVDPLGSLQQYYDQIHLNREMLLSVEVAWLKEKKISLVLVDATPLGCAVGKAAGGVPSVLVSNFSWDYCYKEMLRTLSGRNKTPISSEQYSLFNDMIRQAEQDSAQCAVYLQLPGATPPPSSAAAAAAADFTHVVKDQRAVSTAISAEEMALSFETSVTANSVPVSDAHSTGSDPIMQVHILSTSADLHGMRIIPGPLITRGIRQTSIAALRAQLGIIDDSAKVLLLGFGGHSASWKLQDRYLPPGWVCLVLGRSNEQRVLSFWFCYYVAVSLQIFCILKTLNLTDYLRTCS